MGRVTSAVDNQLLESPNRLNPNQVLLRERLGAADQQQEDAYRRENYLLFKKNLLEAFNKFNVNNDEYLQRDEYMAFMRSNAAQVGQELSEEHLDQIFAEMDVDGNNAISKEELIELQFKAFKNCEDNIEFLAKDINSMEEKIKEVQFKLKQNKERPTNFKIDVPVVEVDESGIEITKVVQAGIMKGSTLSLNIVEGEFNDEFFDPNAFTPMIEVVIKDAYGGVT